MDLAHNPFIPGAGNSPPSLVGRELILEKARAALARLRNGKPIKSFLLVGLRGVGKTVLLTHIHTLADEYGFKVLSFEAHEGKNLPSLLVPLLRQTLLSFDRSEPVVKALKTLKSFVSGVKLSLGNLNISLDVTPERGLADSGDLELDLPDLFVATAQAAASKKSAIFLIIDEMQYLSEKELSALIMALHRISQRQLPLVLIGAGLPQLVALCGDSKTYAERLFDFPAIGPLTLEDSHKALQGPVEKEGVTFQKQALDRIFSITEGYPYFIQQWGYYAWNVARKNVITKRDVEEASIHALAALDESFFRVRFDRLTKAEKKYLRAMAELGADPQRSGDIAKILGIKVQSLAPIRNSLINKGMIYSPQYGDTAFTVPLFDQFMKRTIPSL